MNAIVSILYGDDERYVNLLVEQAKTLSTQADYLVIAADDVPAAHLERLPQQTIIKPAIYRADNPHCQDLVKIHAWALTQYEKVLLVDADCTFASEPDRLFEYEELGYVPGQSAPINAARLIIEPNVETYNLLLRTWREPKYDFHCGRSFQGLLWHLFRDHLNRVRELHAVIGHVGQGKAKFAAEHRRSSTSC